MEGMNEWHEGGSDKANGQCQIILLTNFSGTSMQTRRPLQLIDFIWLYPFLLNVIMKLVRQAVQKGSSSCDKSLP